MSRPHFGVIDAKVIIMIFSHHFYRFFCILVALISFLLSRSKEKYKINSERENGEWQQKINANQCTDDNETMVFIRAFDFN